MLSKQIIVNLNANEHQIGMLVQLSNQFESKVHLRQDNILVNCKSIMGVLGLNIKNGASFELITDGSDETVALEKIENYLSNN